MSFFPPAMPRPEVLAETEDFWAACRERRLVVQRCARCGEYRHTPKPICPRCGCFEHVWETSRGQGAVFTYTIVHHAVSPLLAERVPYNAVVVKLDDCGGSLITSNVVDVPDEQITIGMRVQLRWEDVGDGLWLYRFERSDG